MFSVFAEFLVNLFYTRKEIKEEAVSFLRLNLWSISHGTTAKEIHKMAVEKQPFCVLVVRVWAPVIYTYIVCTVWHSQTHTHTHSHSHSHPHTLILWQLLDIRIFLSITVSPIRLNLNRVPTRYLFITSLRVPWWINEKKKNLRTKSTRIHMRYA